MARKLDTFPGGPGSKPGPKPKYPWDQWTDGDIWEITRGEDFHVATQMMQINLHQHARKNGMQVKTQTDGNSLVFKFYRALPPF